MRPFVTAASRTRTVNVSVDEIVVVAPDVRPVWSGSESGGKLAEIINVQKKPDWTATQAGLYFVQCFENGFAVV